MSCARPSAQQLPPTCTRVALDVGTNIGTDSHFYLKHGMCVVGVDALPNMIKETERRTRAFGDNITLINIGLAEGEPGCLPLYVPRRSIWATFEYAKALTYVKPSGITNLSVPTEPCERLWSYVPPGVRPQLMKIDIEERHYVCVEALGRVPSALRPTYVSWEQHFGIARDLAVPLLDVQLILLMSHLGYDRLKVVSNRRGRRGDAHTTSGLPEAFPSYDHRSPDRPKVNTSWRSVSDVLINGIGKPVPWRGYMDWFDFQMKRADDVDAVRKVRHAPPDSE